jgi:hypothetical protein
MLDQAFDELLDLTANAVWDARYRCEQEGGTHECYRRQAMKVRRQLHKIDRLLEQAAEK